MDVCCARRLNPSSSVHLCLRVKVYLYISVCFCRSLKQCQFATVSHNAPVFDPRTTGSNSSSKLLTVSPHFLQHALTLNKAAVRQQAAAVTVYCFLEILEMSLGQVGGKITLSWLEICWWRIWNRSDQYKVILILYTVCVYKAFFAWFITLISSLKNRNRLI